jgi:predicted dehydrogenase
MEATVKIGFLGAGLIGNEHATGLSGLIKAGLIDASLSGVYDPDLGRARSFQKRFGFERVYSADRELIESDAVDVVYITTWTSAHPALVEIAAAAGKPVFCEKPLARNLDDARLMGETARAAGIPNQIGLILRTSPAYGFARHLVRDTELGRLMTVNFRDDQYFPIQGVYRSEWRKEAKLAGGGTFIEHSIHDVDLMRWIFGDFSEIRAITRRFAGFEGVEDLALVTGELVHGGQVVFTSVWHNILSRESNRFCEMFFENGRVVVENEVFGPVTVERGEIPVKVYDQAEIGQWYMQANPEIMEISPAVASPTALEDYQFLRALLEGRQPGPDFSVGVAAHEVIEAAYRSARENRPVTLPLD